MEGNISKNSIISPCDTSVAIVGSGAIGGYYGARLWESNYNVKFLARGEHFQACKEKGLDVKVELMEFQKTKNIFFFLFIGT